MLHVVILVRSVFVPDEVSDESADHETVATHLLQEITLTLEHLVQVLTWQVFCTLQRNSCLLAIERRTICLGGVDLALGL
jgi:hypothetical protein